MTNTSHIGLALGGGGARGLAHIKILQVMDEFGLKPKAIAGTSMGALVGALYASGMSGQDIERYARDLFSKRTALIKRLYGNRPSSWANLINLRTPAILNAEPFFEMIMPDDLPNDIQDLKIPFFTVAADFYTQEQAVINTGALLPAIAASSALPALLKPVQIGDQVLIDGGFVNPVPYNVFDNNITFTIGVDVTGEPARLGGKVPNSMDALIGASQIMLRSLTNTMLKIETPNIFVQPKVGRFNVLDYFKIDDILTASEEAAEQFRHTLDKSLSLTLERVT